MEGVSEDMEPLKVRFEQKRGHFMIIERDPPITRSEINETQMHMFRQCDIPGLLPLDTEDNDGQISLKFLLSGNRMLSEALRATSWSMYDMMNALCRLGEVLEECRNYLLDADRVRLFDEFIFVGKDWNELSFTYIPIDMPTLHKADDLERLIIRWMLKVKEPDGYAIQNLLKLVTTKGFIPLILSRYARQYLAGSLEVGSVSPSKQKNPMQLLSTVAGLNSHQESPDEISHAPSKPLRSWDIFQPPTGDPHTVSEMWNDDLEFRIASPQVNAPRSDGTDSIKGMDISRWRVVLLCSGLLLVAMGWRFIYSNESNEQNLLLCICLTLMTSAGLIFLWKGQPSWMLRNNRGGARARFKKREVDVKEGVVNNQEESPNERFTMKPRFPNPLSKQETYPPAKTFLHMSTNNNQSPLPPETTWLTVPSDQTTLLDHNEMLDRSAYCLIWEKKESANERIPLQGNSLVIGRSSDASQHVDPTIGISRAHAELVRTAEEWRVKDLGSRNGSKLNDQPMAPYELYLLQTGDCLTLGNSQYRFHNIG